MGRLYLIRHGQTIFNLKHKIQGWCDSPLTEKGRQQAVRAHEYFKKQKTSFDFVYSSTSERAIETGELVTNKQYPISTHKKLKEWNFGSLEGESDVIHPSYPFKDFFVDFGGESQQNFERRAMKILNEIMSQKNHDSVLIVSHGLICRACVDQSQTNGLEINEINNCCILVFDYRDGDFTLLEAINDEG